MRRAYLLIRHRPEGRFAAFEAGLAAAGFSSWADWQGETPRGSDVLVIWNRVGGWAAAAETFEAAGATVLVAENGHLPHAGSPTVALAIGGHNGAGRFPAGGPARWTASGNRLAPWRSDGSHVLVCGQRGIGPGAAPAGWLDDTVARLRSLTDRPIRRRPHPASGEGRAAGLPPLAHDLRDAWCLVTWSSNAATEALLAGVPAIVCGPHHILADACGRRLEEVVAPPTPDRLAGFRRLAWAQWTLEEIAEGEPFRRLTGGGA